MIFFLVDLYHFHKLLAAIKFLNKHKVSTKSLPELKTLVENTKYDYG